MSDHQSEPRPVGPRGTVLLSLLGAGLVALLLSAISGGFWKWAWIVVALLLMSEGLRRAWLIRRRRRR